MVVLDATHIRTTWSGATLAVLHRSRISGNSVSSRIAFCRRSRPPGFPCSTMRLMTSAP